MDTYEGGSCQGLVSLGINLGSRLPLLWDHIEEYESLLHVTEVHVIGIQSLEQHVHPLHVWMRIVGGAQFH